MTKIITKDAQVILAAAGAIIISLGAAWEAGLIGNKNQVAATYQHTDIALIKAA